MYSPPNQTTLASASIPFQITNYYYVQMTSSTPLLLQIHKFKNRYGLVILYQITIYLPALQLYTSNSKNNIKNSKIEEITVGFCL